MYETAGHLSLTKHYSPCTGSSELDSAIEMRYLAIMLSTSASMINVQHDEILMHLNPTLSLASA
jgi:hypothetical protein